jgi:cytidine deaminase
MFKLVRKAILAAEIDQTVVGKKREYKSLAELVTMLYAVILGMGLSELAEVRNLYDLAVLMLGYLAVILSWWGYNWGILRHPETNVLNYTIDVLLMAVYWWLIYWRDPIFKVILGYVIMFSLYWAWELVRQCNKDALEADKRKIVQNASRLNLLFFALSGVLLVVNLDPLGRYINAWLSVLAMFSIVVSFRWFSYRTYHPKVSLEIQHKPVDNLDQTLADKARDAARNARVHLSDFRVGAAIAADSDEIYTGCNVEFDNYSNTIHAEESAISAFVMAGEKKAIAIAVYTFGDDVAFPCGMCRQSLFELGGKTMKVLACNPDRCDTKTMGELLPEGFRL